MTLVMTEAMDSRVETVGGEWVDRGCGYAVLLGMNCRVAYIAIPPDHPAVGSDYLDHPDCEVHGGLTYANSNVFGWDYLHFGGWGRLSNVHPSIDFASAMQYFQSLDPQLSGG